MKTPDMNFKFYFSRKAAARSYLQTMIPFVELKFSLLFFDCILMGSKYFDNFMCAKTWSWCIYRANVQLSHSFESVIHIIVFLFVRTFYKNTQKRRRVSSNMIIWLCRNMRVSAPKDVYIYMFDDKTSR